MQVRNCFVDIMASNQVTVHLSPVQFTPKDNKMSEIPRTREMLDNMLIDDVLCGAQISGKRSFRDKKGSEITVTPVIVDFRRLLQSSRSSISVIPGVSNRDLLHAVVGLYSVSLSEMTPDVLYSTVCEKWARNIILIKDSKDVVKDIEDKKKSKREKNSTNGTAQKKVANTSQKESCSNGTDAQPSSSNAAGDMTGSASERDSEDEDIEIPDPDVFQAEDEAPSKFATLYSDSGSDGDSDSGSEEDDFSEGIHTFLKSAARRKQERKKHHGTLEAKHVGIEDRIVGCVTFEKKYCKMDKVIHLTVVAVRRRYRGWGIGRYLVQQVKDPVIVAQFDAVVVHADNSAIDFFGKFGFTDDVVLNSKWSELAEQFTQCTMMTYLPPFSRQSGYVDSDPLMDIMTMDQEIKKWREKSLDAYQSQFTIISRLRHEIVHLRALALSQREIIKKQESELEKISNEKFIVEKDFLEYRLTTATATLQTSSEDDPRSSDDDELLSTELALLSEEVDKRVSLARRRASIRTMIDNTRCLFSNDMSEPYDHGKDMADFFHITQEFKKMMEKDTSDDKVYEVSSISKATLMNSTKDAHHRRLDCMNDPGMVARLYFCGAADKPERFTQILKKGFSKEDFCDGEYGTGLYFAKFPSKAALFSGPGKLLLTEVGIGNPEEVKELDKTKLAPSGGYDSLLTPGRMCKTLGSGDNDSQFMEYVVFDPAQALPLCLVEYTANIA